MLVVCEAHKKYKKRVFRLDNFKIFEYYVIYKKNIYIVKTCYTEQLWSIYGTITLSLHYSCLTQVSAESHDDDRVEPQGI